MAAGSLVGSVVGHVAVLLGVGWLAFQSLAAKEARLAESHTDPPNEVVNIELPAMNEGTLLADREVVPEGTPPDAHGGATVPRMDTQSAGKGGTTATCERAQNLAANDDGMHLSPDLLSRLDRDQEQRLKTAALRTTHEDRRATTNPMELTFLATGTGEHQERRPKSAADPSRGSLAAHAASVLGGHPGAVPDEDVGPGPSPGSARPGQLMASPGVGVRDGLAGTNHTEAARVAKGRPDVTEGPPTIPGTLRARPNDTVDSDQEVATTVRSLVHASVAGGLPGEGRGGEAAPAPDPGAGGAQGRGSLARPLGTGDGDVFDFFTNDPALLPYFRKMKSKIDPLWANAFPKSAMLELKQGTVILAFTVRADGSVSVSWPPVRPSGIEEFDKNCAEAIRRAGPFEPIPASLGRSVLHIRAPFVAVNPIIK
jgi:TonB family protein